MRKPWRGDVSYEIACFNLLFDRVCRIKFQLEAVF